jgi:hypothetical protein
VLVHFDNSLTIKDEIASASRATTIIDSGRGQRHVAERTLRVIYVRNLGNDNVLSRARSVVGETDWTRPTVGNIISSGTRGMGVATMARCTRCPMPMCVGRRMRSFFYLSGPLFHLGDINIRGRRSLENLIRLELILLAIRIDSNVVFGTVVVLSLPTLSDMKTILVALIMLVNAREERTHSGVRVHCSDNE